MVYKRFRIVLVSRVLLLGAFIFLFYYLVLQTSYYAATFIVAVIIIYQVVTLIHYVEKTNRDLSRFLDAIKYSDFSQTFISTGLGSSFNELKEAFNEVILKFQQTRSEKEEHYRFMQTVVQHVGVGVISFDSAGDVNLINTAAKRLLSVPYLKNIQSLKSLNEELVDRLFQLQSGDRILIRISLHNEDVQLMMYATEFRLHDQKYILVSLQNIGSELEEKELEAWQKLIRVLTHEIMNSITPISSLAATTGDILKDVVEESNIPAESVNDINNALETIRNRSQGLLNFVDAYRNLTRIPRPNFRIFSISDLFDQILRLMDTQLEEKKIDFQIRVSPQTLELTADPELIEQVLINLVLNAVEAVSNQNDGKIELTSRIDERGRVLVQISDNGPGMIKEVQEKIFVPFFTTKKGGSGIGLSLSRQIMRLHRGSISVHSEPRVRTTITLRF
jgi:nitrogen fixation/metabolism regulation signal transduction histidine kinase